MLLTDVLLGLCVLAGLALYHAALSAAFRVDSAAEEGLTAPRIAPR